MAEVLPAIFFGHGNPMNALLDKWLHKSMEPHRTDNPLEAVNRMDSDVLSKVKEIIEGLFDVNPHSISLETKASDIPNGTRWATCLFAALWKRSSKYDLL